MHIWSILHLNSTTRLESMITFIQNSILYHSMKTILSLCLSQCIRTVFKIHVWNFAGSIPRSRSCWSIELIESWPSRVDQKIVDSIDFEVESVTLHCKSSWSIFHRIDSTLHRLDWNCYLIFFLLFASPPPRSGMNFPKHSVKINWPSLISKAIWKLSYFNNIL